MISGNSRQGQTTLEPHPCRMHPGNPPTAASRRARFARKTGRSFGAALGDILLPPGQSVAALVRAAAQKALADKGYAVVEVGSPHYATATPLGIDIVQFWSWFSPGFASVRIDFKGELALHGAGVLGRDPTTVTSHVSHDGMAIFESDWTDLVQRGVQDLSQRIEEKVKPAVAGR